MICVLVPEGENRPLDWRTRRSLTGMNSGDAGISRVLGYSQSDYEILFAMQAQRRQGSDLHRDKRAIMCADCAYALPDGHEPRNIATDKPAQSVH